MPLHSVKSILEDLVIIEYIYILCIHMLQDLYCVRSDLGNLLKALARLDEAKVGFLHLLHIAVN